MSANVINIFWYVEPGKLRVCKRILAVISRSSNSLVISGIEAGAIIPENFGCLCFFTYKFSALYSKGGNSDCTIGRTTPPPFGKARCTERIPHVCNRQTLYWFMLMSYVHIPCHRIKTCTAFNLANLAHGKVHHGSKQQHKLIQEICQ